MNVSNKQIEKDKQTKDIMERKTISNDIKRLQTLIFKEDLRG